MSKVVVRGATKDNCCPSLLDPSLGKSQAVKLAQAFTALADPVRLQVINILAAVPEGEVCVCELVRPLGKSQPTVSYHMKILSDAGLVHGDKRGRWVWYSLDRERLEDLRSAL